MRSLLTIALSGAVNRWLLVLLLLTVLYQAEASNGDYNYHYKNCMRSCNRTQCQPATKFYEEQGFFDWLLRWDCQDDCKYKCMWESEEINGLKKNWKTQQYHGKWPFIRIFGMQEPASSIFSFLNGLSHCIMIRRYMSVVPRSAPLYWMWIGNALSGINAWIWSTVFHARDTPLTERLDYHCATSLILWLFFTFFARLFVWRSKWLTILSGTLVLGRFSRHILSMWWRIDYRNNMTFNVFYGTTGSILWLIWCAVQCRKYRHVKYTAFVIIGSNLLLTLELNDFPPILSTFDAHSIWHGGTIMMPYFWYSFGIQDSLMLLEEKRGRKLELPTVFTHSSSSSTQTGKSKAIQNNFYNILSKFIRRRNVTVANVKVA